EHLGPADVASMDDEIAAAQRVERLRAQQAVGVGNDADEEVVHARYSLSTKDVPIILRHRTPRGATLPLAARTIAYDRPRRFGRHAGITRALFILAASCCRMCYG